MRPRWKKAAEYADKGAFTREDVKNASVEAFTKDWSADVSENLARSVCEIFGGQNSLFRDQKASDLESLRRLRAGHGMAHVLIDCAVQVANRGQSGADAAVEATANALAVWGARHARQIEEHFCRESTQRRAGKVRERLEEGISSVQRSALARQLLRLDGAAAPQKPQKKTGLDDGVSL